jgi:glycerol uptake facilitator-like aquaporin
MSHPLRLALALWCLQVLVLALGASLLMYADGSWVDPFERVRAVRNFMANPVEMIAVEAFGTFCLLVGLSGVTDSRGSLFDSVWERYVPLFK